MKRDRRKHARTCSLISTLLCISLLLSACGKGNNIPPVEPTSEPTPTVGPIKPSPTPKPIAQSAAFLAPRGVPEDYEGFIQLCENINTNLPRLQASLDAIEGENTDNKYNVAIRSYYEEFLNQVNDIYKEFANLSVDEVAEMRDSKDYAPLFLMFSTVALVGWSGLEELEAKLSGYVGICTALCEGNDAFDFSRDIKELNTEEGMPDYISFREVLPTLPKPDKMVLADEYLSGYGMENPQVLIVGYKNQTDRGAYEYIEALKDKGFYVMENMTTNPGDPMILLAVWVGEDGNSCFVCMEYLGEDCTQGSDIQQNLAADSNLMIIASNFDFLQCLNVAISVFFG